MSNSSTRGTIEVVSQGLLTTVQDEGRFEHQHSGLSASGVMDNFAHKTANILCGNANWNEAVLEVTMLGPTLKFNADAYIAITGADLSPAIDGAPVQTWQSLVVKSGSTLSFGAVKHGVRAYIGICGGFDIPLVMGSKSTYIKAKVGGIEGRALRSGDIIAYTQTDIAEKKPLKIPQVFIPAYTAAQVLRVVLGPQDDAFTAEGISTCLTGEYTVTPQNDRMGCRLSGQAIKHKASADIISDGIVMGAVQVPGEGQPIILMADRQTTGGYTKIAAVMYADLYKVAQAKQGDTFRFANIPIEAAQDLYVSYLGTLNEIAKALLVV